MTLLVVPSWFLPEVVRKVVPEALDKWLKIIPPMMGAHL